LIFWKSFSNSLFKKTNQCIKCSIRMFTITLCTGCKISFIWCCCCYWFFIFIIVLIRFRWFGFWFVFFILRIIWFLFSWFCLCLLLLFYVISWTSSCCICLWRLFFWFFNTLIKNSIQWKEFCKVFYLLEQEYLFDSLVYHFQLVILPVYDYP
jgi:hypothetical protein